MKDSQSVYLKQHKNNPIGWFPWGKEAINKAKSENKPIFLSIGYSACHWCHVMATESFENPEVAEFLNENFISIKVDKEEYPDIDQYYQHASQLFSQSGGWPLTAFLLPNTDPFFVGTYFPLKSSHGKIGFRDLIKEIDKNYKDHYENIKTQSKTLSEAIDRGFEKDNEQFPEGQFPGPNNIFKALEEYQDKEFGGYGQSPKFPQFSFYEWALEMMAEGHIEEEYGQHVIKTLSLQASGGLFDQIRGGIHRYSTDRLWLIPHFEKMLYDQAGFLATYSKFSNFRPNPILKNQIHNTLDYLEKEMMSDSNFFFSAQGASSDGEEGLYFCYTIEEFKEALKDLPADHLDKALKIFNVSGIICISPMAPT